MPAVNPWSTKSAKQSVVTKTVAGTSIAVIVALALGFSAPVFADELDNRQNALEQEIEDVQQSIEYLDADISETIAQLRVFQGQLPGAQQALADAQGRVETATGQVTALTQRVDLAQETRNKISEQMDLDQEAMGETREMIGQIATQAYKNGGVPSNLSLLFGSEGTESLTNSIDMVDQALRSQNAAMDQLSQQNATNVNSEARLEAVEAEILDLKAQAEQALAAEQIARDDAAAEKSKVDTLVADTSALSDELKEQKPVIEAQLAEVESAHEQVTADIAARQARLIEEARKREEARLKAEAEERARIENERRAAEAAAAAEAANAAAAAAAAAAQRPAPKPVAPEPIVPATVRPIAPIQSGSPSAFGLRAPVSGPISSGFGWRATPVGTIDFNGSGGYTHTGLDYGVGCGTPLYAPAAGEVWFADSNALSGAGNRIVLNHGVVQGNALATNYYHLSSFDVSPGQKVSAGQLIGRTGTTGNSSGCHLHFETVLNGSLVDPLGLL
ncbi:peptidoglycan DD-metalloendopeptidase family protein [Arthrobacter sp. Sr33]|uniref:M23 family metallopeptidase n=1 Tax=Arthrobacter sp. TB 23 TaxID=494419 RepID=UPI00037C98F4|nr:MULTISPECIES: M23 family metallopeptidase [unclassified Arthrobacter]PVE18544.1 peptidase M23 [Arthrobacter sp. Bz4]